MDNLKKKNIFQIVHSLFQYKDQTKYDFIVPENIDEEKDKTISYEDEIKKTKMTTENKNVFPALRVNLEYMKVRYNTLINSDIVIREFNLIARNKQYSAFLLYIDGMVDTKLINEFILNPLMLRNRANIFDAEENRIVSEAITSNISVRKIKKFNLLDYIFSNLMPQNSVKKVQQFDEIISRY